ncbi:MAG: glycine betaine ABC transporter substrate-binding protein [Clostridium sp.]|uniref:glycine betaine ABC transporter substrate-binding protein n=1 Tax=Clostridium sp. TaxID=1506 RepID=UPI003D6CA956
MNKKLKTSVIVSVLTTLVALSVLTGCSKKNTTSTDSKAAAVKTKPTIKVGSKDFTESLILSELYAIALEKEGYTVDRKFNLSSAVVHTALINGDIDFYPEYTGTGLLSILKQEPMFDSKEVYDEVSAKYKEKFKLIWLEPSLANDGQGLVIAKKASNQYNIHTISDLQKNAANIRFASQGEFNERSDGLPALIKTYGDFNFKDDKIYDNGLKYDVLHNDKADVTVAYTTEGQLSKDEFMILEDDKHVWPPYNIAPVIKQDLLHANPEIGDILNKVTKKIDNKTIIKLNAQVDIDKEEYMQVAKNFFDTELAK